MRASHGLPVQFLFSYFSASPYTSILAECVEPAAQDRAPILFHNARSFEYYNAGGINTIVCVCVLWAIRTTIRMCCLPSAMLLSKCIQHWDGFLWISLEKISLLGLDSVMELEYSETLCKCTNDRASPLQVLAVYCIGWKTRHWKATAKLLERNKGSLYVKILISLY